jgi:hypothetical protein
MPAPVAASPSPAASDPHPAESVWPRALAEAFSQQSNSNTLANVQPAAPGSRPGASAAETHKLRGEIARLELLVKKLQTELQIERQYNQALELHARTFAQTE